MPRIAIDSNVLVSALHFGGTPEALLLLANEGRVELFVSPFILAETARVLKSKLGWTDKTVRDTIALIREVVTVVEPTRTVDPFPTTQPTTASWSARSTRGPTSSSPATNATCCRWERTRGSRSSHQENVWTRWNIPRADDLKRGT